MKTVSTILGLIAAAVTCSALASDPQTNQPAQGNHPLAAIVGTWVFIETQDKTTVRHTFTFTEAAASTCLSGVWHQAKLLSAADRQVLKPAYRFEAGKLELLLSSELCDSYNSYVGNVNGKAFSGVHVSYGLGFSKELGKVTGMRRN